jgi:hypothetical protein
MGEANLHSAIFSTAKCLLNRDDLRLWLAPPLHKVLNYGFRCLCGRCSIFWVGLTFDRYFPRACETVKGPTCELLYHRSWNLPYNPGIFACPLPSINAHAINRIEWLLNGLNESTKL